MEVADAPVWKVHPTSTGRLMAFELSQLHLGCFFFSLFCSSLWRARVKSIFDKIAPKLNRYLIKKFQFMKPPISKPVPILVVTFITIHHHMVVIHVPIGKNLVDDELLDGGLGVNIFIEKLKGTLGLPKP